MQEKGVFGDFQRGGRNGEKGGLRFWFTSFWWLYGITGSLLFATEKKKKIKPKGVLQELEPPVRTENNKEKAKWLGSFGGGLGEAPAKSLPRKY